jgi:endogenous inhibitor of DNA gyrase (YacG/DUF329 family)
MRSAPRRYWYKNGGWNAYRYGGERKAKIDAILSHGARKAMVDRVADLLRDWSLSHFQNEATVRHGLRQAFCLQGHGWTRADAEATYLTDTAIKQLGYRRPDWAQGQPDHARESDFCNWCHGPIDEKGRARRQRFCSPECARVALEKRGSNSDVVDGGIRNSARRLVAKAEARPKPCAFCETPFQSYDPNIRFCSNRCVRLGALEEQKRALSHRVRPCEQCGNNFTPETIQTRFCSARCQAKARYERLRLKATPVPIACTCCGVMFTPARPWAERCSPQCSAIVMRWRSGTIRRISPRVFDYMFRCEGARITGARVTFEAA